MRIRRVFRLVCTHRVGRLVIQVVLSSVAPVEVLYIYKTMIRVDYITNSRKSLVRMRMSSLTSF